MKSYALPLILILLLFIAGCGRQEVVEETATEESSQTDVSVEETATPTVDDITNVETVEEDLSVNDEEDDYGDII